jgi:hypothetical protein
MFDAHVRCVIPRGTLVSVNALAVAVPRAFEKRGDGNLCSLLQISPLQRIEVRNFPIGGLLLQGEDQKT